MKNERKRLILFWLNFCSLFGAWKIVGNNLPSTKQAAKTQPNQNKYFSSFLTVYLLFKCRFVASTIFQALNKLQKLNQNKISIFHHF